MPLKVNTQPRTHANPGAGPANGHVSSNNEASYRQNLFMKYMRGEDFQEASDKQYFVRDYTATTRIPPSALFKH